jgi:hypothetical protein
MKPTKPITWVVFFRWLIDREWYSQELAHLTLQQRYDRLYMDDWKRLLKKGEFKSNGYRRRTYIRILKEKIKTIRRIRRNKKDGHVAEWILK